MSFFQRHLTSLFCDRKEGATGLSLGRMTFFALFVQSMWIWSGLSKAEDLPDSMLTVLLTLLGYNLGSKGVATFSELQKRK